MMPRKHIGGSTFTENTSRMGLMTFPQGFWEEPRRSRRSCEFNVFLIEFAGTVEHIRCRIWDKEHFNVYHERPSQENRERLISLAVGERK